MSSPLRGLQTPSRPQQVRVVSGEETKRFLEGFNSLIARRAYNLFEQCGRANGDDVSHWLQAENEMATLLPEVRELPDSFTIHVSLPGFVGDQVRVWASENRAIISAESIRESQAVQIPQPEAIYYRVRWPENVDPGACNAQIENGELMLTARRAAESETTRNPADPENIESWHAKTAGEAS